VSRIVVLCEGDTEDLAVRHFIFRQWQVDGFGSVGLKRVSLGGKPEKAGDFAGRYLGERAVLAVFTLIDLQGMTRVVHPPQDNLEGFPKPSLRPPQRTVSPKSIKAV
jgi:hypothetical protein